MTEQELREETALTVEDKAQLFLMDFEVALFGKCPKCGHLVKKFWSANEWGAKLVDFIKEAGYRKG